MSIVPVGPPRPAGIEGAAPRTQVMVMRFQLVTTSAEAGVDQARLTDARSTAMLRDFITALLARTVQKT
jgi:hypothetical protein